MACGILAVRLRQIGRRAPELGELVELAAREVGRIVDGSDEAQELLKRVLEGEQRERTRADGGSRE